MLDHLGRKRCRRVHRRQLDRADAAHAPRDRAARRAAQRRGGLAERRDPRARHRAVRRGRPLVPERHRARHDAEDRAEKCTGDPPRARAGRQAWPTSHDAMRERLAATQDRRSDADDGEHAWARSRPRSSWSTSRAGIARLAAATESVYGGLGEEVTPVGTAAGKGLLRRRRVGVQGHEDAARRARRSTSTRCSARSPDGRRRIRSAIPGPRRAVRGAAARAASSAPRTRTIAIGSRSSSARRARGPAACSSARRRWPRRAPAPAPCSRR